MMKFNTKRSDAMNRRQRGQSVVEFAFSLPFILMIVLIVTEMGIVFSTYLAVVNAAREGAVFASMYPELADHSCQNSPHSNCVGQDDDMPYGGVSTSGGVTTTTSIWEEYTNRITNESFIAVGERLRAGHLIDQSTFYIERPIAPHNYGVGDTISVTVHYSLTTFSSSMSFPFFGRMGLPNAYHIHYDFAMPIR